MTQSDWGVMDPYVETGVELADHLNEFRDALHSLHRGATRPAYAVPGTLWIDDAGGPGEWKLMIHLSPAGGDRQLATFDTATAGFPTTIDVNVLRAATHYADSGQYRWAYPLNTTNLRNWTSYVNASGELVFARMNDGFSAELATFKIGTNGSTATGGGIVREVTLASPAATIDLFSLGVKSCKVLFKLQPATNGVDLNLRIANGAAVNSAANYALVMMFHNHNAPPPAGLFLSAETSYRIALNVTNTGYVIGEITFPDITAVPRGLADVAYNQADAGTSFLSGHMAFNGGTIVGDGLRFQFATGNLAAGSFVRVIGWP